MKEIHNGKVLITCDVCESWLTDEETAKTAMQTFSINGHHGVACPDCWTLKDYKGLKDAKAEEYATGARKDVN